MVQRTDIDPSRIVVFGRSLGGAVGAVLTKNNPDKVMNPNSWVCFYGSSFFVDSVVLGLLKVYA